MKKIPQSGVTGQQGVNLVERIVLKMGFLWHPTGGVEAGIDGFIEFRDPNTGEVLNLLLPVQSKATSQPFASETENSLTFTCERDDLDYWLQGSRPIVLVLSRPDTEEAYWVSIKDYFSDPGKRKSRKIIFDKRVDRFDVGARDRLRALAVSKDGGTYFTPLRKSEAVLSNLLHISRFPAKLYHADTSLPSGAEIRNRLNQMGVRGVDEWTVRRKRVVSVYDLREEPWRGLVDRGTVEEFDVEEWANSGDWDVRSDFVDLLGRCLQARLFMLGVKYDRDMEHYYFTATPDLTPRTVGYRSIARGSKRTVFQSYIKKETGEVSYYRHNAFQGRFRDYDGEWFLQIDPTYRFTADGWRVHPYYESKLKGILAQEKNPAVLGQVVMWADLLSDDPEQTLFTEPPYPYVGFDALARFESLVGINDELWLSSDESAEAKAAAREATELSLFDFNG
jgi:Domain of unknown function (DUF4365)